MKASFAHVQDSSGRIQIYVTRSELDEEGYAFFKAHDLGDIIWIKRYLFFTNKGELSIHVTELRCNEMFKTYAREVAWFN